MKKQVIQISLLAFLLASQPLLAQQVVTKEFLLCALESSDDRSSILEAEQLALQNPTLLEEILFITNDEMDNGTARSNAFHYLLICSLKGSITQEHFFDLALKLIKNIDQYAFPDQISGEIAYYRGNLALYGYNPSQKISILSFADNCEAFLRFLDKMRYHNLIDNDGILKSLKVKIENAQSVFEKQKEKGKVPAINMLNSGIQEANGQKEKHLTLDGYYIVVGYFENLIAQIQNVN